MFPRVLGGRNGDTKFYSMDINSDGDIIIGGGTSDPSIIDSSTTNN